MGTFLKPTADDILAAQALIGGEPHIVAKGRAWDPLSNRWYKDGYAPWQLASVLVTDCIQCGGTECLYITSESAECVGRCAS